MDLILRLDVVLSSKGLQVNPLCQKHCFRPIHIITMPNQMKVENPTETGKYSWLFLTLSES